MNRFDEARVAGEQRFDEKRFVRRYDEIDPRSRNVHTRQIGFAIDEFVDLRDDDAVLESGGFGDRRGVLGTRAGIEVAVFVRLVGGDQRDIGYQIDEQARIQFDIGMDGADFEHAGDPLFEQVEMFRQTDARHDHVQVMQFVRICLRQHACEKIGLFLVVAFQYDTVARGDEFFQHGGKIVSRQHFPADSQTRYPPVFFLPPGVPFPRRDISLQHGMSPFV